MAHQFLARVSCPYNAVGANDDGTYVGLQIGQRPGSILFDGVAVIVRREAALAQADAAVTASAGGSGAATPVGSDGPRGITGARERPDSYTATAPQPKRFYGAVKLYPLRVGSGAKVEVVLEVRAYTKSGLPEATVRTVGENAKQLKFTTFEFEDE